uniref:Uncharacterized protein n=1 Tax=Compsopogon caeruleus TaxID=31354 RepID=A0A7S1XF82_9RHOD
MVRQLEEMERTTPKALWLQDLDSLEVALRAQESERVKEMASVELAAANAQGKRNKKVTEMTDEPTGDLVCPPAKRIKHAQARPRKAKAMLVNAEQEIPERESLGSDMDELLVTKAMSRIGILPRSGGAAEKERDMFGSDGEEAILENPPRRSRLTRPKKSGPKDSVVEGNDFGLSDVEEVREVLTKKAPTRAEPSRTRRPPKAPQNRIAEVGSGDSSSSDVEEIVIKKPPSRANRGRIQKQIFSDDEVEIEDDDDDSDYA